MKEIKMFQCDVCKEKYEYQEDANKCEQQHYTIEQTEYKYKPYGIMPDTVTIYGHMKKNTITTTYYPESYFRDMP